MIARNLSRTLLRAAPRAPTTARAANCQEVRNIGEKSSLLLIAAAVLKPGTMEEFGLA